MRLGHAGWAGNAESALFVLLLFPSSRPLALLAMLRDALTIGFFGYNLALLYPQSGIGLGVNFPVLRSICFKYIFFFVARRLATKKSCTTPFP